MMDLKVFLGSYGIIFLFVDNQTNSKDFSACFQVTQKLQKTSINIKWLSVQPEIILNQYSFNLLDKCFCIVYNLSNIFFKFWF